MSAIDLNQNLVGLTNQSLNYIKYEQNRNFVNCEQEVDDCYPNNGHILFCARIKLSRITIYEILFSPDAQIVLS